MCSNKKCKNNESVIMRPEKPEMDMQLPKPAIPYKYTRLCSDKNCQSTRCYQKKDSMRSMYGNDMNCQDDQ